MINDLKKTKDELARLLYDLGLYYELREYDGEALKRYLLDHYQIFLHITHWRKNPNEEISEYNRDGWHYDVIYISDNDNCVSQDLQVYETYDDVLYNGLTEAFAFVSLHKLNSLK
jgi:hypothetical protein